MPGCSGTSSSRAPTNASARSGSERPRTSGRRAAAEGKSESPARLRSVKPAERDLGRLRPASRVARQIFGGHEPAALLHQLQQRAPDRPLVHAARPVFGERLERRDQARLPEQVALVEERATGRVDLRSLVHRHHAARASADTKRGPPASARPSGRAAEPARRDAARAGSRARSRARRGPPARPERRTSRCRPRSGRAPSRTAPRARRARPPGLASQPGDGHEAVEVPRPSRSRVEVDPVPAAEEAGHHGLGHTRGKSRGHGGIGRVPALGEDLCARLRGRRMACGDAASHARSLNPVPILSACAR